MSYTVHPGNEHDSRTWKPLYDKVKNLHMEMMLLDAGYNSPAITRELLKDGIQPLFPYKRPMTKEGFYKKYDYVYDEYYDCYICPYLSKCTESKEHEKTIFRHIWEEYLEAGEDIRHTLGNKEIYLLRKETIVRLFGSAKEQHGFRYTQYVGNARMRMKAGLTFLRMNLEKLAKILDVRKRQNNNLGFFLSFTKNMGICILAERVTIVWFSLYKKAAVPLPIPGICYSRLFILLTACSIFCSVIPLRRDFSYKSSYTSQKNLL